MLLTTDTQLAELTAEKQAVDADAVRLSGELEAAADAVDLRKAAVLAAAASADADGLAVAQKGLEEAEAVHRGALKRSTEADAKQQEVHGV